MLIRKSVYGFVISAKRSCNTVLQNILRSDHGIYTESDSFYSVLLQTQETSAKTISGRCRRGHLEKSIHECMYAKIILINKSKS